MYFPILRGKQFELLALRDLAPRLNGKFFSPIIEPVRSNFSALSKTVKLLNERDILPIIIVNPYLGDFADLEFEHHISELITSSTEDKIRFLPCISTKGLNAVSIGNLVSDLDNYAIFIDGDYESDLLPTLKEADLVITHRYRRSLRELKSVVVIEDGFEKKSKNSEYEKRSFFSELHCEFDTIGRNVVGFGDYTITGSQYSESGGPAFVVTIHLSYIDPLKEHSMYVRHFKSYDDGSPTQPGEKFGDALEKLVRYVSENKELFSNTIALEEFFKLNHQDHFPGLGSAKKLSISHHIETLCLYLEEQDG